MIAANVMSTDLVSLSLDASVRDAIELFQGSSWHDFPVVDKDGRPVGVVTARSILHFAVPGYASNDLLAIMKAGPDIGSVYKALKMEMEHPISDVIDRDFDMVKGSTATSAVAAMLINLKGDTHNILVVDETGVLIGIISARDIICRQSDMTETSSTIT